MGRKKMDQNAGMIWHPRGQRLLIALLKKYETMRGYLMEALFDEKMVGEDQWWSFLDLTQSGVKVIGALYSSGNEKEQRKLRGKIKPICKNIKEKYMPKDLESDVEKAFDTLCQE